MKYTLSTAVLLALASPAFADGLSYNYLEAGFAQIDLDDDIVDVDGDGFEIGGSFEVGDQLFVFADYGSADFDFGVDLDQLSVGLGFHTPLSNNADFVAKIAYVSAEVSAFGFSADEDGFGASIGLRGKPSERVELEGFIDYVDLGDGDDTSVSGAAWYEFTEAFAVGLNVGLGDDVTSYGIGARLYFGQ